MPGELRLVRDALRQGRLEVGCELAWQAKVELTESAPELLERLARAIVARGVERLRRGDPAGALDDARRAALLVGDTPTVLKLRHAAGNMIVHTERARLASTAGRASVQDLLRRGELTLAGRVQASEPTDQTDSDRLRPLYLLQTDAMDQIRQQHQLVAASLERASLLIDRGEWSPAALELRQVLRLDRGNTLLASLRDRLVRGAVDDVRRSMREGRFDKAGAVLEAVESVAREDLGVIELRQCLGHATQARLHLLAGRVEATCRELRQFARLLGGAGWVDAAVDQLCQAARLIEGVRCGPLGSLEDSPGESRTPPPGPRPVAQAMPLPSAEPTGRYLLRVDGVGSFLVLTAASVTIGPLAARPRPDIALATDPSGGVARVWRDDEDYFVSLENKPSPHDASTRQRLLSPGDKIAVSPRCKVSFQRPCPASSSAVIDLGTTRTARSDVRRVILLDNELVIGPGGATHVRHDALPQPLTLRPTPQGLRADRDLLGSDQRPTPAGQPLPFQRTLNFESLSLSISAI